MPAARLCQRVAFLNEGRIVALDTPRHLKIAHGQRLVKVLLQSAGGREPAEVTLSLDQLADARRLSDYMAQGQVITIHSEEATLEDIFIKLAGRGLM